MQNNVDEEIVAFVEADQFAEFGEDDVITISRVVTYTGTTAAVRRQLAKSLPVTERAVTNGDALRIDIRQGTAKRVQEGRNE